MHPDLALPQKMENKDRHGRVMECGKLTKVMEICDQSCSFTNSTLFYLCMQDLLLGLGIKDRERY